MTLELANSALSDLSSRPYQSHALETMTCLSFLDATHIMSYDNHFVLFSNGVMSRSHDLIMIRMRITFSDYSANARYTKVRVNVFLRILPLVSMDSSTYSVTYFANHDFNYDDISLIASLDLRKYPADFDRIYRQVA